MIGAAITWVAAGVVVALGTRSGIRSLRGIHHRRIIDHWCEIASATGSYIFVPSHPRRWSALWLSNVRAPFAVRVEFRFDDSQRPFVVVRCDAVLSAAEWTISIGRGSETDELTTSSNLDIRDRRYAKRLIGLIEAHPQIEPFVRGVTVTKRRIRLSTSFDPMTARATIRELIEMAHSLAANESGVLDVLRSLPHAEVVTKDPLPTVIMHLAIDVELSIQVTHNTPRTVAAGDVPRALPDFGCDIGAGGEVPARLRELLPDAASTYLPTLAMCRLRKRGGRVELSWPWVEAHAATLIAGAQLISSFAGEHGPYR